MKEDTEMIYYFFEGKNYDKPEDHQDPFDFQSSSKGSRDRKSVVT